MKRIATILITVLGLFFMPISYADTQNNIISFSTTVEKEVKYDLLEVVLFTQSEDKELESATHKVNTKINQALDVIKNMQMITIKDNSRSTNVHYNSKNKQDGWRAYGKLVLESQDNEQLSKVLTALNGVLAIESVNPSVSSKVLLSLEDDMIKEALSQFQHKASLMQSLLKAKSYKIKELNIQTPMDQYQYTQRAFRARNFTESYENNKVDLDLGESKTVLKANVDARIEIVLE